MFGTDVKSRLEQLADEVRDLLDGTEGELYDHIQQAYDSLTEAQNHVLREFNVTFYRVQRLTTTIEASDEDDALERLANEYPYIDYEVEDDDYEVCTSSWDTFPPEAEEA